MTFIQIVKSNITKIKFDAIVIMSENISSRGGGGMDGPIYPFTDPELFQKCQSSNGVKIGEAKITKGHDLSGKLAIYTLGPIYQNGKCGEAELLASCYWESLKRAEENNLQSIAFPCISYGYPKKEAVEIAIKTVLLYSRNVSSLIKTIYFLVFSEEDFNLYVSTHAKIGKQKK